MKRRDFIKSTGVLFGVTALTGTYILTKDKKIQGASDMFWKIEPSGTMTRIKHGEVCIQIRYDFFLKPSGLNYNKRLFKKTKAVKDGFKVDKTINKTVQKYKYVPIEGEIVNPPFHCHLIRVPARLATDEFLTAMGNAYLAKVAVWYENGDYDKKGQIKIKETHKFNHDKVSSKGRLDTDDRVNQIKNNKSWL